MIYIFKGFQSCCELPGKLCSQCSRATNECCDAVCKPCGDCCNIVCDAIGGMCSRPLGCYVFGTLVMSVSIFTTSLMALSNSSALTPEAPAAAASSPAAPNAAPSVISDASAAGSGTCEGESLLKLLMMGFAAVAVINLLSAVYVQRQVWEGLLDVVDEEERANSLTGKKKHKKSSVAELILSSSGKVFCYDVCFCFYFFLLIGQFVMAIAGDRNTQEPNCGAEGWRGTVFSLAYAYPIMVAFYTLGWVIFLYCHSCVEACCAPFGDINCCFGRRPTPREADSDSSDEDGYGGYANRSGKPKPAKRCCCFCIPV